MGQAAGQIFFGTNSAFRRSARVFSHAPIPMAGKFASSFMMIRARSSADGICRRRGKRMRYLPVRFALYPQTKACLLPFAGAIGTAPLAANTKCDQRSQAGFLKNSYRENRRAVSLGNKFL
jgi:hypothetical protein